MVCLGCRRWGGKTLCEGCWTDLTAVAPRRLASGLLVRSAFVHAGPARALVHLLKYQGLVVAADLLAAAMAPMLPPEAVAVVPVPRLVLRRWRFGVDPGLELARRLAERAQLPLLLSLRAAVVGPVRAGRPRAERTRPRFGVSRPIPDGLVLIDDVVTTGTTLIAAHSALGFPRAMAVTATGAVASHSLNHSVTSLR